VRTLVNPGSDEAHFFRRQWLGRRTLRTPRRTASRTIGAARTTGTAHALRTARGRTTSPRTRAAVTGSASRVSITTRATRRRATGCTRTAGAARRAIALFRRHGGFGVQSGNRGYQLAVGTVTHLENGTVIATFQHAVQRVQVDAAPAPLLAVAAHAGRLKERLDVVGIGKARFVGGRRQLADVNRSGRGKREAPGHQRGQQASRNAWNVFH